MNIDKYGQPILSNNEVFNALYAGTPVDFSNVFLEDQEEIIKFNTAVKKNFDNFSLIKILKESEDSIEFFDEGNQCTWFMPQEYTDFPIMEWLYSQCTTQAQKDRVDDELTLFIQHGMFDLLFYLKYLVDTMRKNNVLWGAGRGSSVASYVLFLIGIHKVDSIKYELDIREFLK
jgi:DNA polymerase III alpha subunit